MKNNNDTYNNSSSGSSSGDNYSSNNQQYQSSITSEYETKPSEGIKSFEDYNKKIKEEKGNRNEVVVEEEEFKIFVGNLSPKCSDNQLKEAFKECGEILNVVRPVYKDTGRLKNFAFIFFTNEESMKEALKFNGTEFFNKIIAVNTTLKKEDREKREEERIEFLMRDQSNT